MQYYQPAPVFASFKPSERKKPPIFILSSVVSIAFTPFYWYVFLPTAYRLPSPPAPAVRRSMPPPGNGDFSSLLQMFCYLQCRFVGRFFETLVNANVLLNSVLASAMFVIFHCRFLFVFRLKAKTTQTLSHSNDLFDFFFTRQPIDINVSSLAFSCACIALFLFTFFIHNLFNLRAGNCIIAQCRHGGIITEI